MSEEIILAHPFRGEKSRIESDSNITNIMSPEQLVAITEDAKEADNG